MVWGVDPEFLLHGGDQEKELRDVGILESLKNYEKSGVPKGALTDFGDAFNYLRRKQRLVFRLHNPHSKSRLVSSLEDGVCSSTSRTSSNEKSSSVSDENQLSTSFERESFKLPGGAVASGGGSLTRRSVLDCFRFGRRVLWRFVNSRPCLALTPACVGVVVFGTGSVPVVQWRRRRPWPLSRGAVMLLSISLPLPGCSISRNQWSYVDLFHSVLVPVRMCLFWSCHRSILRQRKLTHLRFSEWAIVKALGSFLWSWSISVRLAAAVPCRLSAFVRGQEVFIGLRPELS
ncbi:hypothetical protein Bca52824_067769 [Brassica carinata]|uniref:Uncharacterized protein n=1 Tax=Brassica carinata TaxID=52824 RepID=A0A8X7QML1_BRACI|nr:hypothetical protein Bca52824_067769 [Brassica carinata]